MRLFLLDHGAGNVQSLANSLTKLDYSDYKWIRDAQDFAELDATADAVCNDQPVAMPDDLIVSHRLSSFLARERSTPPSGPCTTMACLSLFKATWIPGNHTLAYASACRFFSHPPQSPPALEV